MLVQQLAAKEIGARLRQARNERGLTQDELAVMGSFSKRSLSDYENGITVPYRHLREMSRLLKKPEEWFLYGDEPGPAVEEDRLRQIIRDELAPVRAELDDIRALLDDDRMPQAASA